MATPKVDLLLDMKNLMAAYATALSGEWDEKITSINKSIEEANLIWDQVAEGQSLASLKATAQDKADALLVEAQKELDTALAIKEEANMIKADVLEQKDKLQKKQEDLDIAIAEQTSLLATQEASRIQLETSLSAREEVVLAREQVVAAKESDLSLREIDLATTLKQLKDIVE